MSYCRRWFIQYIIYTAIMTTALVLAARKTDPHEYDEGVDKFRGICEALMFLAIMVNLFGEVHQLIRYIIYIKCCFTLYILRYKLYYFFDIFNYLDNGAILFALLIIPFRITNSPVQWIFASLSYLCHTLRALKFSAIWR